MRAIAAFTPRSVSLSSRVGEPRPGIGDGDVGGLADAVGTDLASPRKAPAAVVVTPVVEVVAFLDPVTGLDSGRAGAAVAAIAQRRDVVGFDADTADEAVGEPRFAEAPHTGVSQ